MGSASQNNLGQWAKTPDAVSPPFPGFGGGSTEIPRPQSVALLCRMGGGTVLPLLFSSEEPHVLLHQFLSYPGRQRHLAVPGLPHPPTANTLMWEQEHCWAGSSA